MITVRAGEAFSVELRATPATGYRWSVADLPAGVEPLGDSFTADAREPQLVPASGSHQFRFHALAPGRATIVFVLKRAWEDDTVDRHAEEVQVLP